MINKLFSANGYKISSLYLDDESFNFSSKKFTDAEDFIESYDKTMSMATKLEIRYGRIISIKKEENNRSIVIRYKSTFSIPSSCTISFRDDKDYQLFFDCLENDLGLLKTEDRLSPFQAIYGQLFALAVTFAITAFGYFDAINQTDGKIVKASTGKEQIFNILVHILGANGVLLAGGIVTTIILYKISRRVMNPPNQLKFIISDF
ncbi:hypothetical protein ACFFLS_04565 [Flavobacterium procerum]|uniref:Uncharacterized protein n=1 Tax=Flavobacterium procerum TaxID=1455569 RepID=A0ABV6BLI1_9FLAO